MQAVFEQPLAATPGLLVTLLPSPVGKQYILRRSFQNKQYKLSNSSSSNN